MCDQCGCSEANTEQTLEEKIKSTIELLRGGLQDHGGDVELVDVSEDGVVSVRLLGACVGCPSATMTLKLGIERNLKAHVPGVTEVVSIDET